MGKPAWISELVSRLLPEARPQGRRSRRGGTLRGVAVCLCFLAIRETCRGAVKVRLSAFRSLPFAGGRNLKLPLT
ncbi:MAG: hypothetical protein QOJ96_2246 [Alphaproteobacteria bacterium]|nr:hypothetical protein [Alphaproteobacteria bacterium]